MKIKNALWLGLLVSGTMITSCSKDPIANLTEDESRIYITNFDSTANFSAYKTFSVSDSVAVINEGRSSKELTAVDQVFQNAVKAEMQAKGFTLVTKNSSPDLGINISRIYNTSTGVISYNNFYGGYGGFYDPYYWGYGGYDYYSPYNYATYSIREGALTVDMLNLKDAASTNKINVIWTGLIRGSAIFDPATASSQVKTLFSQSPYLQNQ